MPERHARAVRLIWALVFAFALVVDLAATAYSLRSTYDYSVAFQELGLDWDVQDDGSVWVGRLPKKGEKPEPLNLRITEIDGHQVPGDATMGSLSGMLKAAPGPVVALNVLGPDGHSSVLRQQHRPLELSAETQNTWRLRVATRLGAALFACSVLLFCSLLLALRRPADPVAMLFAVVFALMAASVDPAIQLWMWTGYSWMEDVLSDSWYYLLLIALAAFPDGVFVPRFLRWLFVASLPLIVFLTLPEVNATLQVLVGVGVLLLLLGGQIARYRRLRTGIERQQIKWAAFGFAAGFVLLLIAFTMVAFIPEDAGQQDPLFNLFTLVFFSLGIAMIPLGLLVALTRFRLWEADTVITRSAAYAVVTLIVGVVWAASSDLVKLIIEHVIGQESQAGATTVGAVIAAGIFSPTQSLVLGWTRRRFGGPLDRMRDASARMKKWALTETPAEVATRALAIIDEVMHPSASAIVLDTALSRELVAARDVSSVEDPELVERLELSDEEGPVGTLMLGRRSDRNRYNRQQLEAVEELIPSLAEALRVARSHHSRESEMQQRLDEMAARLAQLEGGGGPKPEPA
jgi:hypothetical protein